MFLGGQICFVRETKENIHSEKFEYNKKEYYSSNKKEKHVHFEVNVRFCFEIVFYFWVSRMKMRLHQNQSTWKKFLHLLMENKFNPAKTVSIKHLICKKMFY